MTDTSEGGFQHGYDSTCDLLLTRYTGRLTLAVMRAEMDARFGIAGVTGRTRFLADCRSAEIDGVDLHTLTDYQATKTARGYPDLRTAVVVLDQPGHVAMAELWAATKPGGKEGGAGVFTNEQTACRWLLEDDGNFR